MFQDSKKEGALEYADWRAEVEEYIKKGYEDNKIKDAMLFSLEGKARRNFRHCDEHGDLLPAKILKQMDMSYNASVDFRDLNARLCSLKQGAFESPKDYYDRMVDIGVALREYHQDRFQPRNVEPYRERVLLCWPTGPVEVLGISYEGQEGVRSGGYAEGAEGE